MSAMQLSRYAHKYGLQAWNTFKSEFRPNFYRLHLLYFIASILISSVVLWGANTGDFYCRYVDALFLCCSSMCNVGLNTVNLGSLNGFQQSVLFVDMLLGDLSLVSISVVFVRRYFFSKYMKAFLQHSKAGQRVAEDIERDSAASNAGQKKAENRERRESPFGSSTARRASQPRERRHNLAVRRQASSRSTANSYSEPRHMAGFGGFPTPFDSKYYRGLYRSVHDKLGYHKHPEHPYLSFQPTLDHKGRFSSLTQEQQQELGGVEYRALQLLTWLLPAYAIFWIGLMMVIIVPYSATTNVGNVIRTAQPGDLDPGWWAVFATVSGYTNCGLSLLNENMIPLANNYLILIFTGMAILVGNTLYPVFLRGTVWLLSKMVPTNSKVHHTLMFLLHHPRRCYLFLFPRKNTYILLAVQVAINLIAWFLFIILNINYTPIDPLIPTSLRWFDGLYQAHGLRSSGFYITPISDVAPALQFFYMVTMYLSAFPIIMSVRQTNIYEERSMGQDDQTKQQSALYDEDQQQKMNSNLGFHLRRQLAYDLWWILGSVWLICIVERSKVAPSPPAATTPAQPTSLPNPHPAFYSGIFGIMFETVSAYGTVGLSLGVPYNNYSFSGAWQSLSKLILMTVMLRGRHRILPMAIDRAILLPGQDIMEELDKSGRVDAESENNWKRQEQKIREEERGSDIEHDEGERV